MIARQWVKIYSELCRPGRHRRGDERRNCAGSVSGDMSDPNSNNTPAGAPVVAIVCNSLPPYRTHFHQRIVREMPEITLWTLVTHESGALEL